MTTLTAWLYGTPVAPPTPSRRGGSAPSLRDRAQSGSAARSPAGGSHRPAAASRAT